MTKKDGIYYLIKEDILTEQTEYFDFETMDFSTSKPGGVPLSTIDSLTTIFENGYELDSYVSKEKTKKIEYRFKIIYNLKRKVKEIELDPVWNDATLNAMSKTAEGHVDFTIDNNLFTLQEIQKEILNVSSGLARRINGSRKESTKLNETNKKIIGALASGSKLIHFGDLLTIFSDYKEFRALYLNYKENKINAYTNTLQEQLKKLYSLN